LEDGVAAVLYVGDEAERLARVAVARLQELVTDAWRMRAPDTLG